MKLLILHLSDMHFGNKHNYEDTNIKAIVGALQQSVSDIEQILVIASGDLTYSGKKAECIQVDRFLRSLQKAIKDRYQIKSIHFALVPGNHDVDYRKGDLGHTGLEIIDRDNTFNSKVEDEIKKQEQFYFLANRFECFSKPTLLHQKELILGNKKVLLNMINTGAFSSIEEDQGYHFLGEKDIQNLSNQEKSDFVITIMHHPHHWYNYRCKKRIEEAIYSRSDLIFVGHEHYESMQKVEQDNTSVSIFSGGKLCDRGNWDGSEFHVAIMDLDTREYFTRKYSINSTSSVYEEVGSQRIILSRDRFNKLGLIVNRKYIYELEIDKYAISKSSQDYFVFPLLTEECIVDENDRLPKEVDTLDSFMDVLFSVGKIIITGNSDTGKSVLAHAIYEKLLENKVVLFIKGNDVTKNFERTIQNAFEDSYSKDRASYEAFKQMQPCDLAIVVDDIDYIQPSFQDSFIEYIGENFGIVVETCQFDIDMDVDIKNRLKHRANTRDFTYFKIAPFYVNKRNELVGNVVRILINDDVQSQERIISILCDSLTKQRYLYSLNPEFIVQFTKYYCANIGDATQNDGSVFSKVFEANLTNLINQCSIRRSITVEKIFIILDKIAFYIYENSAEAYPVSLSQIEKVINEYNTEYGSKIVSIEFVRILIDSKILVPVSNGFIFYDRNYLAYFIAREIRRKIQEEHDLTQFNRAINCLYMPINADIILFLTYITDNLNTIRMILEQGELVTNQWTEFDVKTNDISFLVKQAEDILKPVTKDDRKNEERKRIEQERKESRIIATPNDISIFEGETDELDYLQRLMRSISLMIIIARTLPSFEHMMKLDDKEKCVQLLYKMPLRIFETWAKGLDEISDELIKSIKDFHEWEYRNDRINYIPLGDNEALFVLRFEATSMLLELMNASIVYATRDNTNDFIDAFPYSDKATYSIEHLMGLSRRDDVTSFMKEANRLIEEKEPIIKNMVRRVSRHFMVNSKRTKQSEIDSMNSKLFNESIPHNILAIEKNRNKKKY